MNYLLRVPGNRASTGVKVLASPKAGAAKEMGFDLAELRNAGIAEPFHFADRPCTPKFELFVYLFAGFG